MTSPYHEMNGFTSLLADSLKFENGDSPSLEDVAWANSCLIKDAEAPDIEWESLNSAFSEIIDLQSQINVSSVVENDADLNARQGENPWSIEGKECLEGAVEDSVNMNEEARSSHILTNNNANLSSGELEVHKLAESHFGNALRANLTYELPFIENTDPDFDTGFSVVDSEASPDDIFRVWDLGTPEQEGELMKQLKKALAGTSAPASPGDPDDSLEWNGLVNETVNDITAGLADLSLSPK